MRQVTTNHIPRRGPGNTIIFPFEKFARQQTREALAELEQIQNIKQFSEVCRKQAEKRGW